MNSLPILYLGSYALSLLGNAIAGIALPLIVLQTTGSALGAGAVAAATAVPAIVAGLFMGVVIDRIDRRTSSVVTDVVSALSIAALPVVDLVTGLSLGWFVLFGIIGSLGDVPGLTARDALLPGVVRHGGVSTERLVGLREGVGAVAVVVGPAAAGTLMVLLDGSTVLWITAATSFAAAVLTLLLPRRVGVVADPDGRTSPTPTGTGWSQLRDGWRVLLRSRFLLAVTTVNLALVLVLAALQGLVLPVFFVLEGEPGRLGFVLTALALGTLVGAATYSVAGRRGSRRSWFVVGVVGTTVGIALLTTLASVPVVFAGAFVTGLSNGFLGSLLGVLVIERIPATMLGRVLGTQNAVMTAAPPVGIVVAAVVTEHVDVEAAALVLLGVWGVAFVCSLLAPSLRRLEPSTPPEAGGHT